MRIIHACGMVEIARGPRLLAGRGEAGDAALAAGAPIFCDAHMVAHGVTRARLPAQQRRDLHARRSARRRRSPKEMGTTRTAAAMELWRDRIWPARWSRSAMRRPRCSACWKCSTPARRSPPLILGMPVGFVGAAESKEALIADAARSRHRRARAQGRQRHGGGGDQRAGERKGMSAGRLYGVGLGPGDPELLTVKAVRMIGARRSSPISPRRGGAATRAPSSTAGIRAGRERDAAATIR